MNETREAARIIRNEYRGSWNFMTPDLCSYGLLPWGAYEISKGLGLRGRPIYGVTVVQLHRDSGRTRRLYEVSKLCYSLDEAQEWVNTLAATPYGSGHLTMLTEPWDAE